MVNGTSINCVSRYNEADIVFVSVSDPESNNNLHSLFELKLSFSTAHNIVLAEYANTSCVFRLCCIRRTYHIEMDYRNYPLHIHI